MLQLYKNQAVTNVSKAQVDVRELELAWYCTNYDTLAVQSAVFAGFAYDQLCQPVPSDVAIWMEVAYVGLTCVSLGLCLLVCVSCIFSTECIRRSKIP